MNALSIHRLRPSLLTSLFLAAAGLVITAPNAGAQDLQCSTSGKTPLCTLNIPGRAAVILPYQRDFPIPSVAISHDGRIGFGQPATGLVGIQTPDGKTKTWRTGSGVVELERSLLLKWSASGSLIVVGEREAPGPNTPADNILMSTLNGSVSSVELPGQAVSGLEITDGQARISSYDPWAATRSEITVDVVSLRVTGSETKTTGVAPISATPSKSSAASYSWPVTPFTESHRISGTFGEYRGPDSPHFHNGVDIPKADGSPVYSVIDGRVTTLSASGSNAFVRVENYAYVHIRPATGLAVGDSVHAGVTVLGTILPGQGHVHFIDGFPGDRLNAIRSGEGLTPYVDPWFPEISAVRFYLQTNRRRLASSELTGQVEITFRVEEKNADPGTSSAGLNNGAYIVGYRILSADRSQEVFVPGTDGIVYQFDAIPDNAVVHNVFDRFQASTSSHVYIVTNQVERRSSWDTSGLPDGGYTVVLFAEDTRGNRTEEFIDVAVTQRDILPPPQPDLTTLLESDLGLGLEWKGGQAADLAGFRLYRSSDLVQWSQVANSDVLPQNATAIASLPTPGTPSYYRLVAVDSTGAGNESDPSDSYGAWHGGAAKFLVVDGFDRTQTSGSWHDPSHRFATTYERSLAQAGIGFDTAANEALLTGQLNLASYEAVFWFLGDESTSDDTFNVQEQAVVRAYLESGGNLFVSGSEAAWDLGARGSAGDIAFLADYLKVIYAGDDANSLNAAGQPGSIFDGIPAFTYGGSPYVEDFPDYFTAASGAVSAMTYGTGRTAAVQYEGTFGTSTARGRVVTMGFPFETIGSPGRRDLIVQRIVDFFLSGAVVTDADPSVPQFAVGTPYPNPAYDSVSIPFSLARSGVVEIVLADVLGRRVAVQRLTQVPGDHLARVSTANLSSGVYFVTVLAGSASKTTQLVVSH